MRSSQPAQSVAIQFRQVEMTDAENLIHYQQQVAQQTPFLTEESDEIQSNPDRMRAQIQAYQNSYNSLMLVAVAEDEIIAYASLAGRQSKREYHLAELGITVLEAYWGYGIGNMLMDMLIEFAQASPLRILTLEVVSHNDRAIALYQKFNFKKIATLKQRLQVNAQFLDTELMELILEG